MLLRPELDPTCMYVIWDAADVAPGGWPSFGLFMSAVQAKWHGEGCHAEAEQNAPSHDYAK